MKTNRELAAILFSDISGYTQTMDTDENLAMEQVLRHKEIITYSIKEHKGHLLKEMGDGLLIKFSSAIESVKYAIGIQEMMSNEQFSIRIGIHLGDVITKGSDVFGSGVNIASRIHTASSPGSICISKEIWLQIKNQSEIESKLLGEKEFKGINDKIEVFELLTGDSSSINPVYEKQNYPYIKKIFLPVTGLILTIIGGIFWVTYSFFDIGLTNQNFKTSIAILELKNISLDANSIFADGLTEELISQLTKIRNLKVTPRTDIARFKHDNTNTKEIAKELDVEYIVEGSVRISGKNIRVNATLINATDNKSIWSESYDDNFKNVIRVQDQIASQIVSQLNKRITKTKLSNDQLGGIHPIGKRLTRSLEAIEYVSYVYDYFNDSNYSKVENAKAVIPLLNRAIKQDSTYGEAYALSALARFILIENKSDKAEISLEMQKILIDVETALIYDPYNELALAERIKFKPFETKEKKIINDIKQYHNISNNLLNIRK